MKVLNVNNSLIETYLKLLMNLSWESKSELISRLTSSMKKEKKNEEAFYNLFGVWKDEKSAEDMIVEIREARNFNRVREKL